jgi:hypothetical protein
MPPLNQSTETTQPYQIKRDNHPTTTLYWIAEDLARGRPVKLYGLNCIFCKRTLAEDFKGHIAMIINAPVSLVPFGMSMTVRCKQCKQNYRIIATDSFLG